MWPASLPAPRAWRACSVSCSVHRSVDDALPKRRGLAVCCRLARFITRRLVASLLHCPTMSGAAFTSCWLQHRACRAARRMTSASSLRGSLLLHAGDYLEPVSKQRTCLLLAAYWQASHSSKPGSPGRIMHTGPSASGAASTETAGAAAAAACRPPAPPLTPKPPAAP